jgi:hypothetical protein
MGVSHLGPKRAGQGRTAALIGLWLAVLMLLIGATAQCRAQADAPVDPMAKRLYAYRPGVVRIAPDFVNPTLDEPEPKHGWGIVVGDRDNVLTIATPAHVVFGENPNRPLTPAPRVFLYSESSGTPLTATRVAARFPGIDLAVLTVPKPPGFSPLPLAVVAVEDLRPLETLWNIGRQEQWLVSVRGQYDGQRRDGMLAASGLAVPPGSSGGLVLSEYGALGMVLSDAGTGGITYVLPAGRIADVLGTGGFNVNLLSTRAIPPPRGPSGPPASPDGPIVGGAMGPPTPPVVPSQWETVTSTTSRTPGTRTVLTLLRGAGAGGPATLDDTKLGHAVGSYKQKGWQIEFSSPQICAVGEIHGDIRTGANIMQLSMEQLYCRGPNPCTCFGGNAQQSRDFMIYETLMQKGANAPVPRQDAPPPPPQYRPPSDLSGQTWEFTYNGRDVRVVFGNGGTVTFTPAVFGAPAQWERRGPNVVFIVTPSYTLAGTLSNDARYMGANVGPNGSRVLFQVIMHRADEVPAPGPSPWGPDLSGQTWEFPFNGQNVRVVFSSDRTATFSPAVFGAPIRWEVRGRTLVYLSTPSYSLVGTLTNDIRSMGVNVGSSDGSSKVLYSFRMRRIETAGMAGDRGAVAAVPRIISPSDLAADAEDWGGIAVPRNVPRLDTAAGADDQSRIVVPPIVPRPDAVTEAEDRDRIIVPEIPPSAGVPTGVEDMNPALHLAGQSWSFDTDGRPLTITFQEDRQALLSDQHFGPSATWAPLNGTAFQVKTATHVLSGWFTRNGFGALTGCNVLIAAVAQRNPPRPPGSCRRVQ